MNPNWFKIIRPQTLFASVCPVCVGLLVLPAINWVVATVTLLCAVDLQVLSNLINDYYDFRRGADKAGRVGPRRALAEGVVTERQMLKACVVALVLAIVMGCYLVFVGSWPILVIGVTALLFAWLYTATNHSLSYLGIADIFVFLYYGVVASVGTTFLQTLQFSWQSFYAGAVCGLISMCVLITNNLRDIDDDRAVGKRTFPVRFGKPMGELGYWIVVLLTPLFAWLAFGWSPTMLIVAPGLGLAWLVHRAQGAEYNRCLLFAGLLNVCYILLVVATKVFL